MAEKAGWGQLFPCTSLELLLGKVPASPGSGKELLFGSMEGISTNDVWSKELLTPWGHICEYAGP